MEIRPLGAANRAGIPRLRSREGGKVRVSRGNRPLAAPPLQGRPSRAVNHAGIPAAPDEGEGVSCWWPASAWSRRGRGSSAAGPRRPGLVTPSSAPPWKTGRWEPRTTQASPRLRWGRGGKVGVGRSALPRRLAFCREPRRHPPGSGRGGGGKVRVSRAALRWRLAFCREPGRHTPGSGRGRRWQVRVNRAALR